MSQGFSVSSKLMTVAKAFWKDSPQRQLTDTVVHQSISGYRSRSIHASQWQSNIISPNAVANLIPERTDIQCPSLFGQSLFETERDAAIVKTSH